LSGVGVALLSALLWAVASVLLAMGAKRIPVVPLNLIRCVVSTAFFWALLPFYGGLAAVAAIPPSAWVWLVVSVLGLLVVGDTLYFRSMDLAGVSWAMPVASINPLWAVLLAALFVGEPLNATLLLGAVLVVAGIVLVSRTGGPAAIRRTASGQTASSPAASGRTTSAQTTGAQTSRRQTASGQTASGQTASGQTAGAQTTGAQTTGGRVIEPDQRRNGLLLAGAVSVLWAIGQVALKPATQGTHSVVANSVRQPLGMVMLLALTLARGQWRDLRRLDRRSWAVILVASLVGTGVGTLFFVMAIQQAGAGRAAVLTATAPMMAVPFSMLWLQERPSRWTVAGTLLTTVGIALVAV
jgi:uncharacterized membrane protein